MKRTRSKAEEKRGIKMSLSDVYEVVFKVSTKYHDAGDTKLVSLPIAHKLWKEGKVTLKGDALEKVKELDAKIK